VTVCFFGMYHRDDSRNENIMSALRRAGCTVYECHYNLWARIPTRLNLTHWQRVRVVLTWLAGCFVLTARYAMLPRHDAVITGALCHADVPLAWVLTRIRRVPLVVDVFVSLYLTVVSDRHWVRRHGLCARLLALADRFIVWCADIALLDTQVHIRYFSRICPRARAKFRRVWVSTPEVFVPNPDRTTGNGDAMHVIFYGTYVPLQGVPVIVRAAYLLRHEPFRFTLVGHGQEYHQCRCLAKELNLAHVEFIPWLTLDALARGLAEHDIALGIFGTGVKASLVIPNKVYAYMAAGVPFITRDSMALRELCTPGRDCLAVPAGDPAALAEALRYARTNRAHCAAMAANARKVFLTRASLDRVGATLRRLLENTATRPGA